MTVSPLEDTTDWRRSIGADGLLREFNEAGVIEAADVLVAQRVTSLAGEPDDRVALAVALTVRAVRGGSVCVNLLELHQQIGNDDLAWPPPQEWIAVLSASVLTGDPPVLHIEDGLVYLDRYWIEECRVAEDVLTLAAGRRVRSAAGRRSALPRQLRRTTHRRRNRIVPGADRPNRRSWHREDDDRGPAARAARRAGRTGGQAAPADRTGGSNRQGRGPAVGGGAERGRQTRSARPRPAASADRHDPAPAAGQPTRHVVAVPA